MANQQLAAATAAPSSGTVASAYRRLARNNGSRVLVNTPSLADTALASVSQPCIWRAICTTPLATCGLVGRRRPASLKPHPNFRREELMRLADKAELETATSASESGQFVWHDCEVRSDQCRSNVWAAYFPAIGSGHLFQPSAKECHIDFPSFLGRPRK